MNKERDYGQPIPAGVKLEKKRGVPYYWADDEDPEVFYLELDGVISVGIFVNWEFVEV